MAKFKLYPHNKVAYDKIVDSFNNGQRISSIVQATGTGKTYLAINLAKETYPKKMLFIAPTLAIIEHIQHTINQYDLEDKLNIEFVTYQSFINKSKKDIQNMQFDYLVVDEFHHMGAPIWGQCVTDLINSHEDAYVLGMSAYVIRDKGTAYAMNVAPSMISNKLDDEEIDVDELPIFADSIVHSYDLADAITDGILQKPTYIASEIKLYGYMLELKEKILTSNYTKEEQDKYLKELDSMTANLLKSDDTKQLLLNNIGKQSKCIYFVPTGRTAGVRNIENVKEELQALFPDAVIYSTSSDDLNGEKNREAFYHDKDLDGNNVSKKTRIMVAINQYNEGVHVKGVDTVILGRATNSDIVFFEQLGRALSASNDKSPVCIDLSGNLDYILSLSEEIGDKLRQRYAAKGERILNREMPKFDFGIDSKYVDLLRNLTDLDNSIDNWDIRYNQLVECLKTNNNVYPSITSKNKEIRSLAFWVQKQKLVYK